MIEGDADKILHHSYNVIKSIIILIWIYIDTSYFIQNAFSSKAYFIVHPEWLSENVDPPKSQPLPRKPWPWEQPKYRQNVQRYENGQMTPDTSTPGQNTPLPEFSEPEPGYSYTQPLRNNYESEILERKPAIDLSTGRMYWNIQDQRDGKHIIILPDYLIAIDRCVSIMLKIT